MLSGILLTAIIRINGDLAQVTTPVTASWVAHGIGALSAWLLMLVMKKEPVDSSGGRLPLKYYLGGIFGAFTVILGTMALNGGMPLSSVVALGLVGQMVFSIFSDRVGFMGSAKRRIGWRDMLAMLLVTGGSLLIILDLEA